MGEVRIEPATRAHCAELAPLMRSADVAEVRASGFPTALEALLASVAMSSRSWAVRFDGQLAALVGVVPWDASVLGGASACAWALTGQSVDSHRLTFLRVSRRLVAALLREFDSLANWVDVRHVAALEWLEVLGFEIGPPLPQAPDGSLFCFVSRGRG